MTPGHLAAIAFRNAVRRRHGDAAADDVQLLLVEFIRSQHVVGSIRGLTGAVATFAQALSENPAGLPAALRSPTRVLQEELQRTLCILDEWSVD